jgi:CRISPR-associated protein Cmr6
MSKIGNLSHYHYMRNKGVMNPENRDQIRWNNDLDKISYGDMVNINPAKYLEFPTKHKFDLKTTYPGLLIGSGYAHPALYKPKSEEDDGDFQIGFFFDHTTGLPVIPGSSIKGAIRSVFPKEKDDSKKIKSKLSYINSILFERKGIPLIDENNFMTVFFQRKQVFFDAFISQVTENVSFFKPAGIKDKKNKPIQEPQKERHLFADDYITPHKCIFKEPKPIRFLKIAPGVTFTFQFKLRNYNETGALELKSDDILTVFKMIILDFGLCAKRNVNYGQFEDPNLNRD